MKHLFQAFIDSLAVASDEQTLHDAMVRVTGSYDLPTFAYLMAPRDTKTIKLISNYSSEWTRRYLAQGYERADPVIFGVRRARDPFEWGEGIWGNSLTSRQARLMDEAAEFGIRCGFSFPIHDRCCRYASVTFAVNQRPQSFRQSFAKHKQVLQILAFLFHAAARDTLGPRRLVGGVLLSPRELECLEWAAKGKSAWEVSQILGLSRRTASFHLENAKMKLGVRTIAQAVALLIAARRPKR